MKVLCINCQNNDINRNGGITSDGIDYCESLKEIINNNYDIVGTQEMSKLFTERLKEKLRNYRFIGKYRFDYTIAKIVSKELAKYIENNKILVHGNVVEEKNIKLPYIPFNYKEIKKGLKKGSLIRRIATCCLVDDLKLGKVYVINTHLDYYIVSVQERQINKLLKHIKKVSNKYNVVITGDFNMQKGDRLFEYFLSELNKLGIKRVPIDIKTNASKYKNKGAIDHIFISDKFNIKEYGIVEDELLDGLTDHIPIYVDFDLEEMYDTINS